MAALDKGVLELTADVDGDGSTETGVFHLAGDGEISHEIQKDYIFDNTASGIVSLVSLLEEFERAKREGFYLDIGAGAKVVSFDIRGWDGAESPQWGDGSGTFPADASDGDPLQKLQCFDAYVEQATTDSFSPATLHVGEYTDGTYGDDGAFDPLSVAVARDPGGSWSVDDGPNRFSLNVTCIKVFEMDQPIDITAHSKRGRS